MLLQNLTCKDLDELHKYFKTKLDDNGLEVGVTKDEFLEFAAIKEHGTHGNALFDAITHEQASTITWNDFLDFSIKNISPEIRNPLSLNVKSIEPVAHTKIESVAKIVLIETDQYFCYAIILKHGRVGLYDGNMNFLTSYHAVMTREDVSRPEDERRRRNRWVTDALFCPDSLLFLVTNTARSIVIYEASGLNHVPYWLILSTPNILECLWYKPSSRLKHSEGGYTNSLLFAGDCYGNVMSFTFLQPKNGLLRRKRNDQITLFYWNDFLEERDHVIVKFHRKVHNGSITRIKYFEELELLVTSSADPVNSVVLKDLGRKKSTISYRTEKGISCFDLRIPSKLLITGSDNGIIKLWNIFISKAVAVLTAHQSKIVDIQVMEPQNLFLSCSGDAVLKLWDLKESTCLQTIKLKFPCFRIHGKVIEWGINCIYPGPKRKEWDESGSKDNERECFGIGDINEMKAEFNDERLSKQLWDRSSLFVTCCNYLAELRTTFADVKIECGFHHPILPPPPLQNSVLIPSNWKLQGGSGYVQSWERELNVNVEKRFEELKFILDKDILEECAAKSDINYKIAILELKKEKMHSKVALGSPYLALDLPDVEELKLSEDLPTTNFKKCEEYVRKIKAMLQSSAHKDEVFSSPETSGSSRTKSNKSSIVELPY
ncbi:cilia- and flagella-associated protein 337-like isoform X2 [Euwallacea fornicatus]|uniref:cilia- and flagella-associated protein 337-like isoform X2 n=1 Tax=Euwallacea fornicatus TaxID=995702 RepID=UPI00338D39F9